jgi:UDP-N-acetylglucosamine 1-carboxyvinyltransferase
MQDARKTEERLIVRGGTPLSGTVSLNGAKNATLPALAAATLAQGAVRLDNAALELRDCQRLIRLMAAGGVQIEQVSPSAIELDGQHFAGGLVDEEASRLRHSLLLLGIAGYYQKPLVLPMPGGCALGDRKHDLHVLALQQMGFSVKDEPEALTVEPADLAFDAEVEFHYPSFGATFTAAFAACGRFGYSTVIRNAALNPEVIEVLRLLESMGARMNGIGTREVTIFAEKPLQPSKHRIAGDRIIAATILSAVGCAGGEVEILNCDPAVLLNEVFAWRRIGLNILPHDTGFVVSKTKRLEGIDIETAAFPAFHTDIQPMHGAMMCTAAGSSSIRETILNGRFKYAEELRKMGADVEVVDGGFTCVNGEPGQLLKINGVDRLHGAHVRAHDIRGGAALVLAALGAEGETVIDNIEQIDRGYERIEQLMSGIGGSIRREPAAVPV